MEMIETLNKVGLKLAKGASMYFDEHGSHRGDYRNTTVLDVISARRAKAVPYCDSGHAGLALIEISRKRIYPRSSQWRQSTASNRFLCGRNESGTYFSHAVPNSIRTVESAVQWIWQGKAKQIIRRQGDIAVIRSVNGPKLPKLPSGHIVRFGPGAIEHATHPPILLPQIKERVIVAKRAHAKAHAETRD